MRDIPIIYSGPMVRALLDGRKTMTRRLAWRFDFSKTEVIEGGAHVSQKRPSPWQKVKPGDRLWVREGFRPVHSGDPSRGAKYLADVERDQTVWRPSIHMPRWASRLTLVVTATKVERLQDISEEDARAEGMPVNHNGEYYEPPPPSVDGWQGYGRASFSLLWSGLHGKKSWGANPEVVALTFTVHACNIDAMKAAA